MELLNIGFSNTCCDIPVCLQQRELSPLEDSYMNSSSQKKKTNKKNEKNR